MNIEQRKYSRIDFPLKVSFRVIRGGKRRISSRAVEAETRDISLGGVFLKTNFLEIDGLHIYHNSNTTFQNLLKLDIDLPFSKGGITVLGKVVWYDLEKRRGKYQYNAGVSFLEIDDKDKKTLKKFLDSFSGKGKETPKERL
jgi:c-di-GMP-binding flagellar brake protein YcgR